MYIFHQCVYFTPVCTFSISVYILHQCVYFTSVCIFHISVYIFHQCVYFYTSVYIFHQCVYFTSVYIFHISVYIFHQCVYFTSVCIFYIIAKHIPISIENRLRNLSSSKQIFDEAALHYQEALTNSGYGYKLSFEESSDQSDVSNERSSRKRKIIWFDPPFSKNVCTNVAKHFLDLIDKHCHVTHKFNKLFNGNNLKVSYSCHDKY